MTYPERISIIGGGRWARIITQALNQIAPSSIELVLFSHHNFSENQSWLTEQKLDKFVTLTSETPYFDSSKSNLAIVANSPTHHAKIAHQSISAGVPTLVEKPFTLSMRQTQKLIQLSQAKQTILCAACGRSQGISL